MWLRWNDWKRNSNEYNTTLWTLLVWVLNEYKLNSTFILICKWNINKFLYIVFPFHSKLSSIIDSARIPFCLSFRDFTSLNSLTWQWPNPRAVLMDWWQHLRDSQLPFHRWMVRSQVGICMDDGNGVFILMMVLDDTRYNTITMTLLYITSAYPI